MKPLPEFSVAPSTDLDDPRPRARRPRSVLVFADLPANVRSRLRDRGATLTDAESILETVGLLAERDFHAVILEMGPSTEMVKRIKAGLGSIDGVVDEMCTAARERHRLTPFFLVMERVLMRGAALA